MAALVPRQQEVPAAAERLLQLQVNEGHQEADNYPDGHQGDNGHGHRTSIPWFTLLGFGILTLNSAMAMIRSQGDKAAMAFVGFSYADLVALFVCLRMYEGAPAGSSKRDWLKVAVWILTTLLTLAFSSKVAAVMPPTVAILVWLMAFATIAGGFIAFFIYKEKK